MFQLKEYFSLINKKNELKKNPFVLVIMKKTDLELSYDSFLANDISFNLIAEFAFYCMVSKIV